MAAAASQKLENLL